MNRLPFFDDDHDGQFRWLLIWERLPEPGYLKALGEDALRQRLQETRWPTSICCPECADTSIGQLGRGGLFQCHRCRKQFSVTNGTFLHRTKLSLSLWFLATEDLIREFALGSDRRYPSPKRIAAKYKIPQPTAYRVKKLILQDFAPTGEGLLERAICMHEPMQPAHLALFSAEHRYWLDQVRRGFIKR